mgnify:CR=1 FL=1
MSDNTWTWVSGSKTTGQAPAYGDRYVPSQNNVPGARNYATVCYDSVAQELWVFGGYGNRNEMGECFYVIPHKNFDF